MPAGQLHVAGPDPLIDFLRTPLLRDALRDIARLADAEIDFGGANDNGFSAALLTGAAELPIRYDGRSAGRVIYSRQQNGSPIARAAGAVTSVLEHMLEREVAVGDLAEALMTSYEELNVLYTLLPNIATRTHESKIAEVLVDQAAQTLYCDRVSLLVFDEKRENLRVLASRGLPAHVRDIVIPISGSIAEHALLEEDLILVNGVEARPELLKRSRGEYDTATFAVARVPLRAQGQAVGILAATDRRGGAEFTARDRKLLEGLSAMGASALLNCRLHATINRQMMSTIQALACAVDAKDQYTHDHSGRVSQLCLATARELGMTDENTSREVELSGLLHDIGKIGIPDAILSKPEKLTPKEFEIVKNHVRIGADIVGNVQGLERVANAILHHHERWDGLGYPARLSREEIPTPSKLIAVSDTFDSLTSDRPYRKRTTNDKGLLELYRCKGVQFDPAVVDAFAAVIKREERRK